LPYQHSLNEIVLTLLLFDEGFLLLLFRNFKDGLISLLRVISVSFLLPPVAFTCFGGTSLVSLKKTSL